VSSLKVGSGWRAVRHSGFWRPCWWRAARAPTVVALMSIYANTGQTFYWLKSYGVDGPPRGFAGHKIGKSAGRRPRGVMWPAFAKGGGVWRRMP